MATTMEKLQNLNADEKELHIAVEKGQLEDARRLLTQPSVRVDCLDKNGMSPLQHSAYKGRSDMCQLFLNHGADVNSNYHDHGYSALMFAALSGNLEVTSLMLEAGAKVYHENTMGRNASQMAAFVGQHQCVALINNFFSREDLDYYTVPQGVEKEPKLPVHLAPSLYKLILNNNLNPVKISLFLSENLQLMDEAYKVYKLLELLCEKMMKKSETSEVMALKFHYLSYLVKQANQSRKDKSDKLDAWIKRMCRGRDLDGFPEDQEKLIRASLKEFPYIENQLIQQIVRSIAPTKIGSHPTALEVLTQGINGQRFASDEHASCYVCDERFAEKRCSACKSVNYCNQRCQKLHWSTHKKFCAKLAEEYKKEQEEKKREREEQKKREEEEKRKKEEELSLSEIENDAKKLSVTDTVNGIEDQPKDGETQTSDVNSGATSDKDDGSGATSDKDAGSGAMATGDAGSGAGDAVTTS